MSKILTSIALVLALTTSSYASKPPLWQSNKTADTTECKASEISQLALVGAQASNVLLFLPKVVLYPLNVAYKAEKAKVANAAAALQKKQ